MKNETFQELLLNTKEGGAVLRDEMRASRTFAIELDGSEIAELRQRDTSYQAKYGMEFPHNLPSKQPKTKSLSRRSKQRFRNSGKMIERIGNSVIKEFRIGGITKPFPASMQHSDEILSALDTLSIA